MEPTVHTCRAYPEDPPVQKWYVDALANPDVDPCKEWHLLKWWTNPNYNPNLPRW